MKKPNINILNKVVCAFLSVCIVGQGFGLMSANASSENSDVREKVGSRPSCLFLSPSEILVERLLLDLHSAESVKLIDKIFLSPTDRDQIIMKAENSSVHKDLLGIGFRVCIEWEHMPEAHRTPLLHWEMNAVCRLIRFFWNSNSLGMPDGFYIHNRHVKFFLDMLGSEEPLKIESAERYFDHTLFRLRYLDVVGSRPVKRSVEKGMVAASNMDCVFGCFNLVACFHKGGCCYLAKCLWSLFSGMKNYLSPGIPLALDPKEYGVNDVDAWIHELTCDQCCFSSCKRLLRACDKDFDEAQRSCGMICTEECFDRLEEIYETQGSRDMICTEEYLDRLEEIAVARRREVALQDAEKQRRALLKQTQKEEDELRAKRREAARILRAAKRDEEEAKKKEDEEKLKRKDEEAARLKEEAEDKRKAEEKAKRDAEEAAEREKEAKLKAEHDASGVTKVIEANDAIRRSHANEPNHSSNGPIKFPPASKTDIIYHNV